MAQNILLLKRYRPGYCQLKTRYCEGYTERIEWHHESYKPNPKQAKKEGKGVESCHTCHNVVHFRPWVLTYNNKKTLILARIGTEGRVRMAKGEIDLEALIAAYKPPVRE